MFPVLSDLVPRTVSLHVLSILLFPGLMLAGDSGDGSRFASYSLSDRGSPERRDMGYVVERQQHVMGTALEIMIWAKDRSSALTASEAATRAVAEADRRLSTWREDSELSAINGRESDQPAVLSPMLARDLAEAFSWYERTSGAFSPGLGSLVFAWDLRGKGRVPNDAELRQARAAATIDGTVLIDRVLHLGQSNLRFEEGGFGKGVALRDALESAMENGASCVFLDFGGQIAVGGDCEAQVIGVADPDHRTRKVSLLVIEGGSVATSGLSQKGIVVDGQRYGHVLDPRTGKPADDWGAVTVMATDPVLADCLATALYVMGPDRGPRWIQEHNFAEAVFAVRRKGELELIATPGLRGRLRGLESTIRYLPPDHRRTGANPN